MSVHKCSEPDVEVVPSPFGGCWMLPQSDRATEFLDELFDEPSYPLAPLGGREGYIVEPYECDDIGLALLDAGITWTVAH